MEHKCGQIKLLKKLNIKQRILKKKKIKKQKLNKSLEITIIIVL